MLAKVFVLLAYVAVVGCWSPIEYDSRGGSTEEDVEGALGELRLFKSCRAPADCSAGYACVDGYCSARCTTPTQCSAGYECVGGACVAPIGPCLQNCECDDGNPCTDDICSGGQCSNENSRYGTSPCGNTMGYCNGGWCCTAEYTCFAVEEAILGCQ